MLRALPARRGAAPRTNARRRCASTTRTRARSSSCRAARAGADVRLRPDRLRARAHRQRAAVRRRHVAALVAARDGLRGDARAQHHRHQRQDLRRGAGRERRARRSARPRGTWRTRATSGSACRTTCRRRPSRVPQIVAFIEELIDERARVRGRGRRLLPRRVVPRVRPALGPAARPGRGAGAEPAQGGRPRLRALEGEQARDRGHVVGLALGPRPARLAHRVLGDGRGDLRPGVRDPRRRARPRLPAPRERGRAVAGARPSVRPDLGAQRDAAVHRREDVEVARERLDDPRGDRRVGARGGARLLPDRVLAQADRLLAGDDGAGGRAAGDAAERVHAARRRATTRAVWAAFAAALDDDFDTPAALAVLHEWASGGQLRAPAARPRGLRPRVARRARRGAAGGRRARRAAAPRRAQRATSRRPTGCATSSPRSAG